MSDLKWEHCCSALLILIIEIFSKISDHNLLLVKPTSFLKYTKVAIETIHLDVSKFLNYPEIIPLCKSLMTRLDRVIVNQKLHQHTIFSDMPFDDFLQINTGNNN